MTDSQRVTWTAGKHRQFLRCLRLSCFFCFLGDTDGVPFRLGDEKASNKFNFWTPSSHLRLRNIVTSPWVSAGRLTSLEASLVRCFTFLKHRQKHRRAMFFFKTLLKHRIVKQKVRCFSFQKAHSEQGSSRTKIRSKETFQR